MPPSPAEPQVLQEQNKQLSVTYLSVGLKVPLKGMSFHLLFQEKLGLLDERKELQLVPNIDKMDHKAMEEMAGVVSYLT